MSKMQSSIESRKNILNQILKVMKQDNNIIRKEQAGLKDKKMSYKVNKLR